MIKKQQIFCKCQEVSIISEEKGKGMKNVDLEKAERVSPQPPRLFNHCIILEYTHEY